MEFPQDGQNRKRNSKGQDKHQQGIFQGIATNQRVNTEIPPARSETIKEFPWDGSEVHKLMSMSSTGGGGWINNVISHYKLAFENPLINPLQVNNFQTQ